MRKLLALLILVSTPAFAGDYSKIEIRGSVNDESTTNQDTGLITKFFSNGARQINKVSLDGSTFTNITVPSGAKAVIIDVGTYRHLKLKGVTGDTGISLDSNCPVVMPISSDRSTTTLGILNNASTSAEVKIYWF